MSDRPFKRLVKLVARAFYDEPPVTDKKLKPGRSDNRGQGVVILDYLTKEQWVKEDDMVNDLKIPPKQLRRTLQDFQREKLMSKEYRREKDFNATVSTTTDGQENEKEKVEEKSKGKYGEDKQKLQIISYYSLDYAQKKSFLLILLMS
eukprot:Gb_19367 [translate_table: standard]